MTTVTTQRELDKAIKAGDNDIIINSPRGVWLEVSGSASVSAVDSASVRASGSASVSASGSASVSAFGSASVRAFDSASVRASAYVAVHLHSAQATINGGVVIDVTQLDLKDRSTWEAYTGCAVLLEDDGRGYRLGFRGGWYEAGCRVFTATEAVEHWSNPHHENPKAAALLLAAVQAHIAATDKENA